MTSISEIQLVLRRNVGILARPGFRNACGLLWEEAMQEMERLIRETGYEPKIQEWYGTDGRSFKNMIVRIEGEVVETIILGAHYDSFEETPGADDNASAVAVMLALLTASKGKATFYSLEFVFYACEEPPFFGTDAMGSHHHAQSCNKERIKFMICLEMVGCYSDQKGSQDFPFMILNWLYGSRGNFLMAVTDRKSFQGVNPLMKKLQKKRPGFYRRLMLPFELSGMDWSDHRSYWRAGIPAVMLTDTAMFRNKTYHTAEDLPDKLDYLKMAHLVTDLSELLFGKSEPAEQSLTVE